MEATGYQFENLVLYATDMGLGTVWLATTFSRKDFKNIMEINDDDLFPCISPIGYPAEKCSFVEKIMRASLGSKNRKAWNKLFYLNDFNQTLSQAEAGKFEIQDIKFSVPEKICIMLYHIQQSKCQINVKNYTFY